MKLLIKKILILLMLSTILAAFTIASKDIIKLSNTPLDIKTSKALKLDTETHNTIESKNYYLKNTFEETGSKNIVTGIYLEYRLFDSIFEASILLITSTGIIFISKKDEKIH